MSDLNPAPELLPMEDAIDMFAFGVAQTKSLFYPHLAFREHGLWVTRDDPPRKHDPRLTEVFAHGFSPEETVARVRELNPGRHFLCVHYSPALDFRHVRKEYRALGYRALRSEWLFTRDLSLPIPPYACDLPITEIQSAEELLQIPWDASQRIRFRPRQYVVGDQNQTCGWVHSLERGQLAWVADLHVRLAHRSKGYGKALMARLLEDDRAHGIQHSVLVASVDGARIYPRLGYVLRAEVQLLCPIKPPKT